MGILTRSQMGDLVKFRLGNRTDIDSLIVSAVQFAYDELITQLRVPENQESAVITLETATTKTTYAAPSNLFFPVSLRNETEGERLEPQTIRDYDKIKDTSARAKPTHYTWWRNEFVIHPPNNATARTVLMRYIKRLASLTASTSISELTAEWDEVIVQGAVKRVQSWLGLPEAVATAAEYEALLNKRQDRIAQHAADRSNPAVPYLPPPTAGWSR